MLDWTPACGHGVYTDQLVWCKLLSAERTAVIRFRELAPLPTLQNVPRQRRGTNAYDGPKYAP